ncbi:MAG: FHA domain-containing protein [Planctomycetes bacterium]|nr:FHA domain-containing protein [Planctomycetota bacterium]
MIDHLSDVFRIQAPDRVVVLARGQRLGIGRDPRNELVLHDPTVSRFHACLDWTRRGPPVVVDLRSANATLLDGVRVDGQAALEERCALTLGRMTLTVELRHPAIIPAPEPLMVPLAGERGPELDGVLPGPEHLHVLLLDLAQARRTGTLWLEHEGLHALSRLTLALGLVVDARGPAGRGVEALRQMLVRPGAVRYMLRREVEPCEEPLSLTARQAVALARDARPEATRPMPRG